MERAAVRCATSILHERLARARVYVQCIVGVFIILSGPSEDREPKQKRQRVHPSLPPSAPTVLRPLHRSATDLLELFTTLTRWASIKDRKDELEIDERERKDVTVSYEGWN